MHLTKRERLERDIESHRRELRTALRDLSLSVVLVDLPERIRRHPFMWAFGAAGLGTFLVVRARRRRDERRHARSGRRRARA